MDESLKQHLASLRDDLLAEIRAQGEETRCAIGMLRRDLLAELRKDGVGIAATCTDLRAILRDLRDLRDAVERQWGCTTAQPQAPAPRHLGLTRRLRPRRRRKRT